MGHEEMRQAIGLAFEVPGDLAHVEPTGQEGKSHQAQDQAQDWKKKMQNRKWI